MNLDRITIAAFIILRILTFYQSEKETKSNNTQNIKEISPLSKMEYIKIYNAQNIIETEQLMEMLRQNGIMAFFTGGKCECCDAWGTWLWNIWNGYIRKN